MMKQYKTLFCFLIFAILEFSLLGWNANDVLTFWFLVIIVSILFVDSFYNRRKLIKLTSSLNEAGNIIKEYSSASELYKVDVVEENIFNDSYLNEGLALFIADSKAKVKNGRVEISDYINRDILHIHINKNISAQISGVMTALGILGTFIGLTFGLQKFDINSDTVGLTTNITTLMDGIKIAFHTSILGIIASVCHSYFFNKDLDGLDQALMNFYSEFDKVIPNPQIETINELLEYQSKQTVALEKLSDNISDGIADRMAIAIKETVLPAMENINKSLDSYIKETVDSQAETLNNIVSGFMQSLNNALDDQFKSLAESIDKMCIWQGVTTENIGQITELLKPVVESLEQQSTLSAELNKNSEEIERKTSSLISSMKAYSDDLLQFMKVAESINQRAVEYNAEQKEYLEKSAASVTALVEQIGKNEQLNNELQNGITDTVEAVKEFVDFNKQEKEASFTYQATLQKKINDSTEITDVLVAKISGYIDAVNEITEGHKNIIESTDRICDMLSSENKLVRDEYIKLTEEFDKRNKVLMESFVSTKDETLEQIKALSKTITLNRIPVFGMFRNRDKDEVAKEDAVNDEA